LTVSVESWIELIDDLRSRGITFAPGLSLDEILRAEKEFGFQFPPDLRSFLQTALPCGEGFPDWRSIDDVLAEWLQWPLEGILFDIEHNDFWLPEWGLRPTQLAGAFDRVHGLIRSAPKLIPIYRHRMIPDEPNCSGNPVFSVHQTDIICYGANLRDYVEREFLADKLQTNEPPSSARNIRFWDVDRFQEVRWANGSCIFDNRKGILP